MLVERRTVVLPHRAEQAQDLWNEVGQAPVGFRRRTALRGRPLRGNPHCET